MKKNLHFMALAMAFTGSSAIAAGTDASAGDPAAGLAFFDKEVLPLLERRCFECHSHAAGKAKGGLVLDSKSGWQTGGENGPALVPGDVQQSRLVRAVQHVDDSLKMPPKEKMGAAEIAVLEKWVRMGAPDSRDGMAAASAKKRGIDMEQGRKHWSYLPVEKPKVPGEAKTGASDIDALVRQRLKDEGLQPSPRATARVLIRRLYFDLLGIPPTYEEVETFAADDAPDVFVRLVDRLLARPEYGQRWGRHWLDVARYSDTLEQSVDGERRIPFAHTYRDYVIDALNADKPYDRMILDQLAADRAPGGDQRALGFLTVGRHFRSNADGPALLIDDRIDVMGRGFMAITLACARCHDHKFDPVPTADYYSLYGILGSLEEPIDLPEVRRGNDEAALKPYLEQRAKLLNDWETHVDKCLASSNKHFRDMATEYLRYIVRSSANHRTTEGYVPLDTPSGLLFYQAPPRWESLLKQSRESGEPFFKLWHQCMALSREGFEEKAGAVITQMLAAPQPYHPWVVRTFGEKRPASMLDVADTYGRLIQEALKVNSDEARAITSLVFGPQSPVPPANRDEIVEDIPRFLTERCLLHRREGEAGTSILTKLTALEATAPVERAMAVRATSMPMQPCVLIRGDMKRAGAPVPRRFLTLLSGVDAREYQDDGRLQLAEAVASPRNPLTARVMVNRVWQHHFGVGLVATSDDFGVMGERPSHPALLDHLAAWFMEHGWSVKALHRYILTSATWQQASAWNDVAGTKDPGNRLLWRMAPRRVEFEPLRDSLLCVAGRLDLRQGARSEPLRDANLRRAVYGYTDRFRIPALLRNFDVANPDTSISRRSETLVPLQALYLLNNPFVRQQAEAFVKRPEMTSTTDETGRIHIAFRLALSRDPDSEEIEATRSYLSGALPDDSGRRRWVSFIQALLLSNEFIFVD